MKDIAQAVAVKHNCVIAMSGAVDVITSTERTEEIARGSALMTLVVGTGCLLSAVVGAFHAVHSDAFERHFTEVIFTRCAGSARPLSVSFLAHFRVAMIDALYQYLEN